MTDEKIDAVDLYLIKVSLFNRIPFHMMKLKPLNGKSDSVPGSGDRTHLMGTIAFNVSGFILSLWRCRELNLYY